MPRISYVDGRYVPHAAAAVHVEDRGLQFSDSVYEVVALIGGRFADERGHLDRLERSLLELEIPMPISRRSMQMIARELVRRNRLADGLLYIQVTRGVAPRDFRFPDAVQPTFVMTLRPMTFDIAARKKDGKSVITVPDIRWQRRDIKTTMLLAQALAKQAALDAGAYDAWMVDEKGDVTEATASNAWIVDAEGRLITRPTARNNILKGVTRSALQALCRREKIRIVERAFSVKEAYKAKEAFMSSAVALVVPVTAIDGKKIGSGKPGLLTQKIFDLYMSYATDPKQKQQDWTPT